MADLQGDCLPSTATAHASGRRQKCCGLEYFALPTSPSAHASLRVCSHHQSSAHDAALFAAACVPAARAALLRELRVMSVVMPGGDDQLLRFIIEESGVRGALVHVGDAWRSISERNAYPASVRSLLGETVAAAALFSGHSKIDGRLSIQLKGEGALRTLFAEYASGGGLRGIALWKEPVPEALGLRDLGSNALLAITIETLPPGASELTRYQGMVGLVGERLEQAFEGYFAQSEQLPTRLLLAADERCAAGLMLQQLPAGSEDPDGWTRAQALFDTLKHAELLATEPVDLLHRLFHQDGVRLLGTQPLHFACSCSRQRVASVLLQLGREEAFAAAESQADGVAEIACEMCGQRYRFDRIDLEQLLTGGGSDPAGSPH